jgi:phosphonate transport system substrate-binding protein
MSWRAVAALVGLSVLAAAASGLSQPGPLYTLAVIPSAPPAVTEAQWAPFVERLTRETGLSLKLSLYEKIEPFERDLEKGVPDLIFAHPLQTVAARRDQGYEPLVRGSRKLAGVVFVRRESPVQKPADLARKIIAMVGSRNVCALLVRQELENGEKIHFRFRLAGTGPNVVKAVLSGQADAGATLKSVLEAEPAENREQLRMVLTTPEIEPHPLSAHPRVPKEAREALTAAIVLMGADAKGQQMLKEVRLAEPVKADYARDYHSLEAVDNSIFSTEE